MKNIIIYHALDNKGEEDLLIKADLKLQNINFYSGACPEVGEDKGPFLKSKPSHLNIYQIMISNKGVIYILNPIMVNIRVRLFRFFKIEALGRKKANI